MNKKFISWRRVSTAKQRGSHLGLEAQKSIIDFFIEREKGELIADYEECHSGTDLAGCTELKKAKAHCKKTGATLIIAKTDRCRDTIEALQLYEEMDGKIYFCDLPHTDKFTLTLFFSLAEREAMIVSLRTKQALAALKARGDIKLGAANETFKANRAKKDKQTIIDEYKKMANTKRERFQTSKKATAFLRILQQVFPDATKNEDPRMWDWKAINTKGDSKVLILNMMKTMRDVDETGHLWHKWDFDAPEETQQRILSANIASVRRSFTKRRYAN